MSSSIETPVEEFRGTLQKEEMDKKFFSSEKTSYIFPDDYDIPKYTCSVCKYNFYSTTYIGPICISCKVDSERTTEEEEENDT